MTNGLYSVTKKGQVTIPASIRGKLGIRPHTRVVFDLDQKNRSARIRPAGGGLLSLAGVGSKNIPKELRGISAKKLRRLAEEAIAEDVIERSK